MYRLVIISVVSMCVLSCGDAEAQLLFGRRHHSSRGAKLQRYESTRQTAKVDEAYRSYKRSSGLNISIGIGAYPEYGYYSGFGGYGYLDPYRFDGYGYDPYRYGSFEAPDLLKDPYFRERYRYDSKYPGRYRAPRMPRTSTPIVIDDLYGLKIVEPINRSGSSILSDSGSSDRQRSKVTEQLARGLAVSEYGEAWLEYLGPRQLPSLIARGKIAELQELMSHYDGVVANPELRYITSTPGFTETKNLLEKYLGRPSSSSQGQIIRVSPSAVEPIEPDENHQPENLPAPLPSAEPEASLNSANGV
jgi:hypothetical protein